MNESIFRQVQEVELRRLLDAAENDPVLRPQLERRLAALKTSPHRGQSIAPPRTAIFLRGGGVEGSAGIRPSLAGEALIQYEKMFIEQSLNDEREAAKEAGRVRRARGTPAPELLFTGTPRGSFGLEFVPVLPDDKSLAESRVQALNSITDALISVASAEDSSADSVVASIPSSVLQPMKLFMKTLSRHGAELRLAFHNRPSASLTVAQITVAAERLDRKIEEDIQQPVGVFRGVTLQSGYFDFRTKEDVLISGTVSGDLSESQLKAILEMTDKECKAIIRVTTIQHVTGPTTSYVLLGVAGITTSQKNVIE